MNKMTRLIQNYLLIGLPFVIICIIWENISPSIDNVSAHSPGVKMMWTALGLNMMAWFGMLIVFLVLLVTVPGLREKTLSRLANIKERDEREEYITGRASKTAYISTLSVGILLLFFSIFSFNITQIPPEQNNGAHMRASIGVGFHLYNESNKQSISNRTDEKVMFDTSRYTLSSSSMLLILLCWQLIAFNRAAHKEKK